MNFKLIVGLGNPGPRYTRTFHNAGSSCVQRLARLWSKGAPPGAKKTSTYEVLLAGGGAVLLIPTTYMNRSGRAVQDARRGFPASPEDILVVHDDADLTLGTYRLSFGRGAGGHHGVESIIATLGTKNFWRLRLGIRPLLATSARAPAGNFVLAVMRPPEEKLLYDALARAEKSIWKLTAKDTP